MDNCHLTFVRCYVKLSRSEEYPHEEGQMFFIFFSCVQESDGKNPAFFSEWKWCPKPEKIMLDKSIVFFVFTLS